MSDKESAPLRASETPQSYESTESIAINFRDFGGIPTGQGGRIRTDCLYRSGHMADQTAVATRRLLAYDFVLIADLRYTGERLQQPSHWPPNFANRIFAHDEERSGVAPHVFLFNQPSCAVEDVRRYYIDLYRKLPLNQSYRSLFAKIIRRMTEVDGRVLFHCTAGKDRTGILVALVLHLLGADWEVILADYLRSAQDPGLVTLSPSIRERLSAGFGPERADELVSALLSVEPIYLEAAFQAIERECGSLASYFKQMEVTPAIRESLRDRYMAQ